MSDAPSPADVEAIAEALLDVLIQHQRIPIYGVPGNRCVGCDNLYGEPDGSNSPRHTEHLVRALLASPALATLRAHERANALAPVRALADEWERRIAILRGDAACGDLEADWHATSLQSRLDELRDRADRQEPTP